MPLATLKEVTDIAERQNIGIGMFNVISLEYAEAIISAAERSGTPVILGFPEGFFPCHDVKTMGPLLVRMAERATVPAAVHVDHGTDPENLKEAIRQGFTGIMYDGSALKMEENIRNTAEIAQYAHSKGVSVEGEIGYLGFNNADEDRAEGKTSLERVDAANLTDPAEARSFVERTGVDALAVAIGNMHGAYRGIPKLDIGRLAKIHEIVPCALVLHGGSGLSDADFVAAVENGVRKVNIYTAMNDLALRFLRERLDGATSWLDLQQAQREAIAGQVFDFIEVFARKRLQ
ncbi:MAG: class II fructose-bisphosphate aldolase [Clostridiales bacterium]|nr:class II fructose-bisphosphate aldolase [Clostridiales bacterium]